MEYPRDYRNFLKSHGLEAWREKRVESDQMRGVQRPPAEKPFPQDAVLIDLVPREELNVGNMPVREVIARRKSRRAFTSEPLSLEELSYLLWATQGISRVGQAPDGLIAYRTVPSGGCRHTFETYLVINRVTGVEPGLYRYLPLEHKLLFMRSDTELLEQISSACCGQEFVGESAVVFIWTTIPYRMEWRYTVGSHKIIALDSGHVCQNLYLAAESIGGGACGIGAYFQKDVDAIIGADGEDEFTIYVAPVGKVG